MSISISSPRDNAKISYRCIAYGTKAAGDPRPAGVMVGLTGKDGQVDPTRVIGGTSVVVKKRNGDVIETLWVIHFDMIREQDARADEYYCLRLFNPTEFFAATPDPDDLFFPNGMSMNLQLTDPAPRPVRKPQPPTPPPAAALPLKARRSIEYPLVTDTPPAGSVVAFGVLPPGEIDVNANVSETYIRCNGQDTDAYLAFPDGFGYYYVFFNPVANGTGEKATVHVTYLNNGDSEYVDVDELS